jgi:hypothetical protein
LHVVVVAASRALSLMAACLHLAVVSDQTVRDRLREQLPKCWRRLQAKLNQALLEPLPKGVCRRRRTLAIDLHEIPYHGEPQRRNDVLHKKPRAGTTKFFAYATACLVEEGYRYTLGYTWVRRHEAAVTVLQRLLTILKESGVPIRRLLLDRGFFNVAVMQLLQTWDMPFVMPVVFRGRPPKRGKRHTGLRAFKHKAAGWYRHRQHWQGKEAAYNICVAYKSYRHHRTRRRRHQKLVFATWRVRGTPTQVRQWYRKRFGIETSYRQLGQGRIRTSTRDPLLRLFFVGLALLLRNLWVWLRWLLFREETEANQRRQAKRLQLRWMLNAVARTIENHWQPEPQLT